MRVVPAWVLEMTETFAAFGNFGYPRRSGSACRESLVKSTAKFRVIPEPENLRWAAEKAADRGAKCSPPVWSEDGLPNYEDVCSAFLEMNPDANAGFPYCMDGAKKVDWARANMAMAVEMVQCRLVMLSSVSVEYLESLTAVQLVQEGFVDPAAVIEKNEPHKLSKLLEGRQRNVICFSVIDEAIDRLLFGKIDKAQIEKWGEVPSCIGLGFTDEKIREIVYSMVELQIESGGTPLRSSDVKGFEFSIQKFGFRGDWIRRCKAMGIPESSWLGQLMWKRMLCIMLAVFVFTDGIMYAQLMPGWQKSGGKTTSSTNTAVREIDAYVVGAEAVRAAGDDCVETEISDAEAKYAAIGVELKEYIEASCDDFEFCSHRFVRGQRPVPTNAVKSFFKLCCEGPDEQKIRQVVQQFIDAPEMLEFSLAFSRFYSPSVNNENQEKNS
jgi:hypothetical protein